MGVIFAAPLFVLNMLRDFSIIGAWSHAAWVNWLFLAFVYNVVLIPVAAGILAPFSELPEMLRHLHPILAALAMAMSSISVVSNSLRLYRARIK